MDASGTLNRVRGSGVQQRCQRFNVPLVPLQMLFGIQHQL